MLKKGETANPNGRPKGTPNKVTTDLRQSITDFLNENWEQVKQDFEQLTPKDRLMFIEKLLKYSVPALQATSLDIDFNKMTDEQLDLIIEKLKHETEFKPIGEN